MNMLHLTCGLLLLTLTACSVLQPVKDTAIQHVLEPLVPDRTLTAARPAIAVGRPSLPGYLDSMQLVTRANGTLKMSNHDLWGEPLDTGISRVIASNLSRLTGSMNIQPVESFTTLDYTTLLELKIAQFEPETPARHRQGNQQPLLPSARPCASRSLRLDRPRHRHEPSP